MEFIFPKEIIENTSESNFSRHSTRSKIIYSTTVLSVIGSLLILPFIYVDVGVRSQGIIRPVSEVVQVLSIRSGRIEILAVRNNDSVRKGELIAQIASPLTREKLEFNERRAGLAETYLTDLNLLLTLDSLNVLQNPELLTSRYMNAYSAFYFTMRHSAKMVDLAKSRYERNRSLMDRNFISQSVYEDFRHSLNTSISEFHLAIEQQKHTWQADKVAYQEELDRLATERNELLREQEYYRVRAPASGSIQNLAGVSAGSFVSASQILAEITPDTSLVAEVYLSPSDIGLIREHMPVRFQISAYNYNQWGILEGRVLDMSQDVVIMDNQPAFRVRCSLDQTYLTLNNGYRGDLKKGMTLQARFIVNRRSLFQLLYDKVDDWLNPSWGDGEFAQTSSGT